LVVTRLASIQFSGKFLRFCSWLRLWRHLRCIVGRVGFLHHILCFDSVAAGGWAGMSVHANSCRRLPHAAPSTSLEPLTRCFPRPSRFKLWARSNGATLTLGL
jgi:hypothetical protein